MIFVSIFFVNHVVNQSAENIFKKYIYNLAGWSANLPASLVNGVSMIFELGSLSCLTLLLEWLK
jgi:hypothetical protein